MKVHRREASVGHAVIHDLWVTVWFARGGSFRESHEILESYVRENPDRRLAQITVVRPEAIGPLDERQREQLKVTMRLIGQVAKARATVMSSEGFTGALLRGITTSLALVAGNKHPNRVFAHVDEACVWLAPYLEPIDGRAATAGDVLDVIRAIERAPIRP